MAARELDVTWSAATYGNRQNKRLTELTDYIASHSWCCDFSDQKPIDFR